MIRINLLPKEGNAQRKTAVSVKAGDLVLPVVVLAVAAVGVAGVVMSQSSRVNSLTHSIADVEAQSRALAPQIARVQRLAQERAELDLRLGIINRLEKGRSQSVRLMDELARCVPDHLWLTGATQDAGSSITLEGVTYSNLVVSDFMSRLERSPMFAGVQLDVAERGLLSDRDVVKFHVTAQTTPDEPAN